MIYSYITVKKTDSRGSGRSFSAIIKDYRLEVFESYYGPEYGEEECLVINGEGHHTNMWTYDSYKDYLKINIGKEDLKDDWICT